MCLRRTRGRFELGHRVATPWRAVANVLRNRRVEKLRVLRRPRVLRHSSANVLESEAIPCPIARLEQVVERGGHMDRYNAHL